jgi:hypothetical protein
VPGDVLRLRLEEPGRFDLLEDGLWQAAQTRSRVRHGHIANIVANGLKAEDAEKLDRRHILRLLGEVNDVEVLILCGYAIATWEDGSFGRSTLRQYITSQQHSEQTPLSWKRRPFIGTMWRTWHVSISCTRKCMCGTTSQSSLREMARPRAGGRYEPVTRADC